MKRVLACAAVLAVALPGCEDECDCFPGQVCYQDRCVNALVDTTQTLAESIDILIMEEHGLVEKQVALVKALDGFLEVLDQHYAADQSHIAVITPSLTSPGCQACDATHLSSCINEPGDNGKLSERKGCILSVAQPAVCISEPDTTFIPEFDFELDPNCRVVDLSNRDCLYDTTTLRGTLMVGMVGCGYEKGLAAVRTSLGDELLKERNRGFLREDAILAVVIISQEEDCGEVGETTEGLPEAGGNICYLAAKGVGPAGETADSTGKPYRLTPVEDYYRFLQDRKGGRDGMVKVAAIVGVEDPSRPHTTTIEWVQSSPNWMAAEACRVPNCSTTGGACSAYPGTRYIKMAQLAGLGGNGFVDSICQDDFTGTLARLAHFLGCPDSFPLDRHIEALGDVVALIDGRVIPPFSCASTGELIACAGLEDSSCGAAACVESYSLLPAQLPQAPFGSIAFADHTNPCNLPKGTQVRISVIPATE